MLTRVLMSLTIGLTVTVSAMPAHAQATSAITPSPADLVQRLQGAKPDDLAAAAKAALDQYKAMTPEQQAAAAAAAKAQVPALLGVASEWWSKLTPEQQAAYQKSLQGLSAAVGGTKPAP